MKSVDPLIRVSFVFRAIYRGAVTFWRKISQAHKLDEPVRLGAAPKENRGSSGRLRVPTSSRVHDAEAANREVFAQPLRYASVLEAG